MEFAAIAKWMRMHEVHRIKTAKSMAGISHRGELTGDTRHDRSTAAHMARRVLVTVSDQLTRPWSADATVRAQQSFTVFGDSYDHPKNPRSFSRAT